MVGSIYGDGCVASGLEKMIFKFKYFCFLKRTQLTGGNKQLVFSHQAAEQEVETVDGGFDL